ncbi:unnamed protein product [Rotaria sp. Silwood2]|nr:unnamed protein product [Rotaria sp. Silwood2]
MVRHNNGDSTLRTCADFCVGADTGRAGSNCTIILSRDNCPSGGGNFRNCTTAPGFGCCCKDPATTTG